MSEKPKLNVIHGEFNQSDNSQVIGLLTAALDEAKSNPNITACGVIFLARISEGTQIMYSDVGTTSSLESLGLLDATMELVRAVQRGD